MTRRSQQTVSSSPSRASPSLCGGERERPGPKSQITNPRTRRASIKASRHSFCCTLVLHWHKPATQLSAQVGSCGSNRPKPLEEFDLWQRVGLPSFLLKTSSSISSEPSACAPALSVGQRPWHPSHCSARRSRHVASRSTGPRGAKLTTLRLYLHLHTSPPPGRMLSGERRHMS